MWRRGGLGDWRAFARQTPRNCVFNPFQDFWPTVGTASFTFPHHHGTITLVVEFEQLALESFTVSLEFLVPGFGICLCWFYECAGWRVMLVPEASIDENGQFPRTDNKIGLAR